MSDQFPTPQSSDYGAPRGGYDKLLARIRQIDNKLSDMRNNLLRSAGMRLYEDGVRFDGNLDVNGSAVVAGALSSADYSPSTGWQLDGNNATFNTITLRGGIIGNEALTSPVDVNFARYDNNGWGVSTSWTTVASGALTIPSGYGRVDLVANTHAGAYNNTASVDYLRVRTVIAGTNGLALPERVAAGTYGTAHSSDLYREDDLNGGTISVAVQVSCDFASWSTSATNRASTDVFAVFRR